VLKNVIFPIFRDDVVVSSIKYDKLLIIYGNKLAVKYKQLHQHDSFATSTTRTILAYNEKVQ